MWSTFEMMMTSEVRRGRPAPCWALHAGVGMARRHDHRNAEVRGVSRSWADEWEARGDAAWAADDATSAYDGWALALRADPSRTWVRRQAEAARDIRLELD